MEIASVSWVRFWDWEDGPQAIYARFGLVSPASRSAGLGTIGMMFGEALGRAIGADFIYQMCTLKIPHMQLAFERAGYKLLGFALYTTEKSSRLV